MKIYNGISELIGNTPLLELAGVVRAEGLEVTLTGLSPVTVGYTAIPVEAVESLPETGDTSSLAFWAALACLSLAALAFAAKRRTL